MSKKRKKKNSHSQQSALNVATAASVPAEIPAVVTKTFAPNGQDHEYQQAITNLMHQVVMQDGRFTLAEIGYMHLNTLMFNLETQQIELKVYFDARMCCRKAMDPVSAEKRVMPVSEFNVFKNILFVGDYLQRITYEKILCPKVEEVEDELGRAALQFKKGNKMAERTCAVLNCSFPIATAAAMGVSLMDPNLELKVFPVAKGSHNSIDSIIITADSRRIPLEVKVTYSNGGDEYDPDEAETYLNEIMARASSAEETRQEVVQKVTKKARKEGQRIERVDGKQRRLS